MTDPATPQEEQASRGCWFYGCLTLSLLFVMACVVGFVAVRWMQKEIATYTDSAPIELPKVQMDDEEFKQLQQRVQTFTQGLSDGKPGWTLILTEREVNALIGSTPEMKQIASTMYISFTNHQARAQMSVPLNHISRIAKNRYFNGEATFSVSLENGVLIATADQASVRGKPLPEAFMKKLRQENLAKEAYRNPKTAETISKLESIDVEDGRVVIKAREGK